VTPLGQRQAQPRSTTTNLSRGLDWSRFPRIGTVVSGSELTAALDGERASGVIDARAGERLHYAEAHAFLGARTPLDERIRTRLDSIGHKPAVWANRADALLDLERAPEQRDLQVLRKRLMGLEPTTFCMAIRS
jgi:hypothetical protein